MTNNNITSIRVYLDGGLIKSIGSVNISFSENIVQDVQCEGFGGLFKVANNNTISITNNILQRVSALGSGLLSVGV